MRRHLLVLGAALALTPALAAGQSPAVDRAIAAGQVGERFDGYMGVVGGASPEVARQVSAINIRRRNLYIQLSGRRNVSPQLVGMATACELLSKLAPGEAYMLSDGAWRRHATGEAVALPDYCR